MHDLKIKYFFQEKPIKKPKSKPFFHKFYFVLKAIHAPNEKNSLCAYILDIQL